MNDLLDPGEQIVSDGPAYRVGSPQSEGSDPASGHLLVATGQFISVPEGVGEDVVALRYSQLKSAVFVKQKSGWVTVQLTSDAGRKWAFMVLPRTARVARKMLKRENPAALR